MYRFRVHANREHQAEYPVFLTPYADCPRKNYENIRFADHTHDLDRMQLMRKRAKR